MPVHTPGNKVDKASWFAIFKHMNSVPANYVPCVLIADDDPFSREAFKVILAADGYQLVFAVDGQDALNKALTSCPDIILTDIMMPAMDGFELCRRLRQEQKLAEVPIIMITSLHDTDSRLKGFNAGADDFICKPYDRIELRARLRNIVRLNRFRVLTTERTKFEHLIEYAPDGILLLDTKARIQLSNPAFLCMIKRESYTEVLNRTFLEHVEPGHVEGFQKYLDDVNAKTVRSSYLDSMLARSDGSVFPVELSIVAYRWKDLDLIQIIVRDCSEQKALQDKLQRLQRLETIGSLASGLAHDMNNALAPVVMIIEILKREITDAQHQTWLSTANLSVNRAVRMVKQILTFARGSTDESGLLDVRHVIHELATIISSTFPSSLTFRKELEKELWVIQASSTQIYQLLMNLCVNARDAMPSGGCLTVSASNLELSAPCVIGGQDISAGKYVRLIVADTGCGIRSDVIRNIFDPFFTTKEPGKGTGLGLATVSDIVKRHSGAIEVSSILDQGTKFIIYLPAAPGQESTINDESIRNLPIGNGEKILFVDDEEALCHMVHDILTNHGFQVVVASNGVDALALYLRSPQEFQIVVTDYDLPYIDGLSLILSLRKINPELTCILTSGSIEKSRSESAAKNARVPFLDKPYTVQHLVQSFITLHSPSQ